MNRDDGESTTKQTLLTDKDIEYIHRMVDAAPPMSESLRARLRQLMRPAPTQTRNRSA